MDNRALIVNRLIVAVHTENTDWLGDPHGWEPLIVRKDEHVPNVGREASSFIWAIQQLHRKARPDDRYAFVQGNPFDHCPDLWWQLGLQVKAFRWLGKDNLLCGPLGTPHHAGLPVRDSYERLLGRPFPGYVDFAPGGQFVTTGRAIRRRKPAFWEGLYEESVSGVGPWVLERLWESILTVV
jgi:hypothetical protein